MDLQKNKDKIFQKVKLAAAKANRSEDSVRVVAVTKHVDSQLTREIVRLGLKDLAENRVDKFLTKYHDLQENDITWHFIGNLQRRKVKDIINLIDYFHALDSVKLAREIQKRADKKVKCFLEVNLSGEESKHGFSVDEVDDALEEIAQCDKIELIGLMTMAPLKASPQSLAELFEKTNQLRKSLQEKNRKNMPFTELSMGMSSDFEIAIQHGSTFVRIGTSFFK
ncbi:YggS family pyridoxal phosphate-dependent enzyme [Streptococcus catagoni]|uniref:YggS family pyridoxal phosphate-dependent enzyme n=1 Tax=Streptococcus catagoni TaxID=2654874 RepID=UPI00140AC68B|nr:YggS family pyridoxal phosphate-dependent enzyme [Streptococcus catagoni]